MFFATRFALQRPVAHLLIRVAFFAGSRLKSDLGWYSVRYQQPLVRMYHCASNERHENQNDGTKDRIPRYQVCLCLRWYIRYSVWFALWYAIILRTVAHIDLSSDDSILSQRATKRSIAYRGVTLLYQLGRLWFALYGPSA